MRYEEQTTLPPPYTNRWRTRPGPDYRRCHGTTKEDARCRRCARRGYDFCDQHEPDYYSCDS